jgi:tryptophan 2-monooxygenase
MPLIPNLRTWDRVNAQGLPKLVVKKPLARSEAHVLAADDFVYCSGPPARTQRSAKTLARPQAYIDTPQIIYSEWPRTTSQPGLPLGKLDSSLSICLIGGGMTNLVAGLELAKAGASVTLLEATGAVGGFF